MNVRLLLVCVSMILMAFAPGNAIAAPSKAGDTPLSQGGSAMTFKIESTMFQDKGPMPVACTCDGKEMSPALSWSGLPEGTKSLALIVDDPDAPDPAAPKMTFVHWVLFNIPPSANGFPEGVKSLPPGTREGLNDRKQPGYTGPCPPIGTHRYFHKLYALDTVLDLPGTPTKAELEATMKGHILAQATLMGTYARSKK